jgi:hypothetical protein
MYATHELIPCRFTVLLAFQLIIYWAYIFLNRYYFIWCRGLMCSTHYANIETRDFTGSVHISPQSSLEIIQISAFYTFPFAIKQSWWENRRKKTGCGAINQCSYRWSRQSAERLDFLRWLGYLSFLNDCLFFLWHICDRPQLLFQEGCSSGSRGRQDRRESEQWVKSDKDRGATRPHSEHLKGGPIAQATRDLINSTSLSAFNKIILWGWD